MRTPPDPLTVGLDSPSAARLAALAEQNGTSPEYEAGLAVTRQLNRLIQPLFTPQSPCTGPKEPR